MCFLLIYEKIVVYKFYKVYIVTLRIGRAAGSLSLRLGLVSGPPCGPALALAALQAPLRVYPPRFVSVSHLYHGKPDDLVAQLEAGLEHVADGVLAEVLILNMHHGIV